MTTNTPVLETDDDILDDLGIVLLPQVKELEVKPGELTIIDNNLGGNNLVTNNLAGKDLVGKDPFSGLLSRFYGFAAEDHFHGYFSGLELTEFFQKRKAEIPEIRSSKDLTNFLKSFPGKEEINASINEEIKRDYQRVSGEVAQIQARRTEVLKNPELDYSGFWNELYTTLSSTFNFTADLKGAKTKKAFDLQKRKLINEFSKTLESRLNTTVDNMRVGDEIKVSSALGFDYEEGTPAYYHSGDTTDIKIGSVGELIGINSGDSLSVRLVDGHVWQFHPKEISPTGKNLYADIVKEAGGAENAAKKIVSSTEDGLREKYLELARESINLIFDAKVQETAQTVERKFNLTGKQLKALANGKEIKYNFDPVYKQQVFDTDIFNDLAYLVDEVFKVKYKIRNSKLVRPHNESTFRDHLNLLARNTPGVNPESALEKVLGITTTVLESQVRLRGRIKNISKSDRLRNTLDFLRTNTITARRRIMYNDSDVYVREPFSPPSESHDHVIILQPEYGCTHSCTFCTGNQVKLTVRGPKEFLEHVKEVKRMLGEDFYSIRRVFLDGANVFRHSPEELIKYLDIINKEFNGHIGRIAAYTRTEGLLEKSVKELNKLYGHGMRVVYWGVESGSNAVLDYVNKKSTFEEMTKAAKNIRASNLDASVMIMPGLGGLRFYEDHTVKTAQIVDAIKPRFLTFLTINPDPNSKYSRNMAREVLQGTNMPMTDEMVAEQIHDMLGLMNGRYNCLAAAYFAPDDVVGANPVQFRSRIEYGDKEYAIRMIEDNYFDGKRKPSPLIPNCEFNKDSPLRKRLQTK